MSLMDEIKKKSDELITRMGLYEVLLESSDLDETERLQIQMRLAEDEIKFGQIKTIALKSALNQRTALS